MGRCVHYSRLRLAGATARPQTTALGGKRATLTDSLTTVTGALTIHCYADRTLPVAASFLARAESRSRPLRGGASPLHGKLPLSCPLVVLQRVATPVMRSSPSACMTGIHRSNRVHRHRQRRLPNRLPL